MRNYILFPYLGALRYKINWPRSRISNQDEAVSDGQQFHQYETNNGLSHPIITHTQDKNTGGSIHMKLSMTGQEKGACLIQVTA
jgi:hypothetical protein